MSLEPTVILGIDYGSKRVGVARADTETKIATPLCILENSPHLVDDIVQLVSEHHARTLVVGDSKKLDGTPNQIATDVREFVKNISNEMNIEIALENEFYTSALARRSAEKGAPVDGSAAALILQSYLDRNP
jgi:putative Holliday junction resolvase